jgi:hypothetical protein
MVAHARADLLKCFQNKRAVTDRLARSEIPAEMITDEEHLARVLAAKKAPHPCVALVRSADRQHELWIWMPGLEGYDLFNYSFDPRGAMQPSGSMLHSSLIARA